ncbi:hypothetical protein ABPG74_010331 [Tetrahymena malaccensis]
MQQNPQIISNSQVFNKNEFYQKGFLTQSQISQTPHGIHQVTTTEYPKDSTIVKLISSNAPGAVTQVSPSFQVQSRVRASNRHSTPPGHSRTIIRHSESPLRYVTESISPGRTTTYQDRQIPVAAVVKEQIPLYIIEQQRQPVQIQERVVEVEKPIYIEKIVEIATDQTLQVRQLSERIALLEQTNQQLSQELELYKNQTPQQPEVIQVENNDRIILLEREIERLQDENDKRKKAGRQNESEMLKANNDREEKIRELIAQIEQLHALLNEKQEQINSLNIRITQIQNNEVRQSDARSNDYMSKINTLTLEIERLTKQMKLSREQYDEDMQAKQAQILGLNSKLSEYEQRFVFLNAELERLRNNQSDNVRINQLETRIRELEIIIQQKDGQLNDWRSRFAEMEKALTIYKQYESKLYECENVNSQLRKKIEELMFEIDRLNNLVNQKETELQRLRLEVSNLTINIRQSGVNQQEEINRLNALLQERNQQIQFLNQKVSAFEDRIREQEGLILQLQKTIQDLQGQLESNERVKRSAKNDSQLLEEKINQLTQENARLIEQIRLRDEEIAKLRVQYTQFSQYEIKLQECEVNNAQLRKRIEDLYQEGVKKSQRITELEQALRESGSLQEKLLAANQAIEALQRRNGQLENDLTQARLRINELENSSRTIQELQIRIQSLIESNERLNQLVNQKEAELQKLRLEVNQLNIRITQVGASSEELNLRIREIEQLKLRIRELEQQLINLRTFESRYAELEQINIQLRQQIENLQRALAELQNQVNDEKVKKSRQQSSLDDAIRDRKSLEEKLVHLTTQVDFMNRKIQSLEQENANLRQRNSQLEQASITITTLESRIGQLTQTIENLNRIIVEKDQQLNQMRQENSQLQINIRQSGVNQEEVLRLRREIDELKRLVQEKETIIIQLRPYQEKLIECEKNNAELRIRIEQVINQYNDENVKRSRVNASAEQAQREKALLESQISQLKITIENLSKNQILQDQELQKLRLRNSELENATRSSGTYEIKITALTEEVSKLRALLAQKDNEINQLRLENQNLALSTRQSQVFQQEVNRLQESLNRLNRENEELRSRIREMEIVILQLQQREQRIKDLENENAQLRRRIDELLSQVNEEKVKKSAKDNRSDQELAELRAKLSEAQNNNQKLVFENTRLSEQLQLIAKDNEKLRQTVIQLEQTLASYKTFELKVQQYERTIAELNQRIEQLIAQLTEVNDDRLKKQRIIAESEAKLKQFDLLQERNNQLLQQIDQLNIKIRQLESQLAQYAQFSNLAQQNEQLIARVKILEQENTTFVLKIKEISSLFLEWSSTYSKIQGYNQLVERLNQSISQIQISSSQSVIRYSTQVPRN